MATDYNMSATHDLPETGKVHEVIEEVVWRRFGIKCTPVGTSHDPISSFCVSGQWFRIHIVAERDGNVEGRFAWNGRWNLTLDLMDGNRHIYRPHHTALLPSAEKIMQKVAAFVSWRKSFKGPVELMLVVDNTKGEAK